MKNKLLVLISLYLVACQEIRTEEPEIKVGCYVTHKNTMVNSGKPMKVLKIDYNVTKNYKEDSIYEKGKKHNRGVITKYGYKIKTKQQWFYLNSMKSYQCDLEKEPKKIK